MTTASAQLPEARPFSSEDCDAMVSAGIVAPEERPDVVSGARRFTVDECLAMLEAGILHEDDRIELIDGALIYMAPIGNHHDTGTDWLNRVLSRALGDRTMIRVQGSIRLNSMSAPQPDIAILRLRPLDDVRPYLPQDIFLVVEVSDSSLRYDSGPKLAMYAAAGIPEVWVANLRAREVMAFTNPAASGYTTVRACRTGDSISPEAFPDVVLPIDDFMPPAPGPDVEIA